MRCMILPLLLMSERDLMPTHRQKNPPNFQYQKIENALTRTPTHRRARAPGMCYLRAGVN